MSQKYVGGFITKNPTAPTTSAAKGIWTLDQAANYVKQGIWPSPPPPAPTVIGQSFGGGYYAGQIGVSGTATHYLVVGPVASAESTSKKYKNVNTAVVGADSVIDGPQNTADMVADGDSTVYPAAHFCNDLVIGGFSDWYMPAKNEFEVCYYNLKPTTVSNNTGYGSNTNAVPSRASNYTSGNPAQTSAATFQTGGAEALTTTDYWTSSEATSQNAWPQQVYDGTQYSSRKTYSFRVRAIRRVAV
jgi:hypothetical protein